MGTEPLTFMRLVLSQASQPAGEPGMLNAAQLVGGIVSSLIFVGIGIVVFLLAFLLITKLSPFSIRKEIEEDQNTALGIVIGSVIIGLSIIIAAAMV
jgi:putative membrane protein